MREQKTKTSLRICLLGRFKISVDDRAIQESLWQRRKARALVKLLALQPCHRLHREQAMDYLFRELDPESAAKNLNKIIHAARRVLEPELRCGADSCFIATHDQQVILCAPGELWVDVDVFQQRATEALKGTDPDAYEAALLLYEGDLLMEDPYEDWATPVRERLRIIYQDLLAKLAAIYETRGQYQESIERLKQLIAHEPSSEEAHRQLMRLYARTGRRHQALRQYQQCREAVRRELDAEPEPETVALHEQIVAGQIQPLVSRHVATHQTSYAHLPAVDLVVDVGQSERPDGNLRRAPDQSDSGLAGEREGGQGVEHRLISGPVFLASPDVTTRPGFSWLRVTVAASVLALLALIGIGLSFLMGRNKAIDSLAILPLVNESADSNLDYLANGLTERLINRLSQLPRLRVMSVSTVSRYKGRQVDPQKVGRELGVRAVLSSRVLQQDDRLVIKTELMDVTDGSQLWGEQYNRKLADLLVVQENMTQEISEKLRLRLSGDEKKRLAKRDTENTEAYHAYLKGRYFWNKRTGEGFKKGIAYFEQAIELDPAYALAYTGLADSYILMARFQFLPPREAFPKARAAAAKALEIDEMLAEAKTSLALVKFLFDWDWPGAERGFKRALELNPRDVNTLHWYTHYLMMKGQMDEAAQVGRQALEIDPLDLSIQAHQARFFYVLRQYDQAVQECRKTLELNPAVFVAHLRLGRTFIQQAKYEEAIAEFNQARVLDNQPETLAWLGYAHAASGRRVEAQRLLNELIELGKSRYVSPYSIAIVYTGLGEKDQALAWLDKACSERSEELIWLKVEPALDRLRSDPRFASLLRCVGLAS